MFKDAVIFGSFAVKDIEAAKDFFVNKLGLNVEENDGMLNIKSKDGGSVFVYPKPDHAPAVFTVLNFPVDNIEATMEELRGVGVTFEIYNEEDYKTDEKGVSTFGDTKAAWFKDPSGNIFALLQGM